MQGLFEVANLPYTGMRTHGLRGLDGQAATKRLLRGPTSRSCPMRS